jgi:hypothetical protein
VGGVERSHHGRGDQQIGARSGRAFVAAAPRRLAARDDQRRRKEEREGGPGRERSAASWHGRGLVEGGLGTVDAERSTRIGAAKTELRYAASPRKKES